MTKLEQDFKIWWEREGQKFLYALNTTTDDDIKLVAEIAWKNGAYCFEQAEQEPVGEMIDKAGYKGAAWYLEPPATGTKLYAAPVSVESELIETNKALAKEIIELKKQAEQEPVAWFVQYKNRHEFVFGSKPEFIVDGVVEPLYAAPVRTKDLTDDEIREIEMSVEPFAIDLARAVIAADREKNNV